LNLEGTIIYVLDTGVDKAALHLHKKVVEKDFTGIGLHDGIGHGTAVASIAADFRFGVARRAEVWSMKICFSHGFWPGHLCEGKATQKALEAIMINEDFRKGLSPNYAGAIINISADLPGTRKIRNLITKMVSASQRMKVVAAAGNDNVEVSQPK
jgi:subtilisin family serine protease